MTHMVSLVIIVNVMALVVNLWYIERKEFGRDKGQYIRAGLSYICTCLVTNRILISHQI